MKDSVLPAIRCTLKLREDMQRIADQQGRTLSGLILLLLKTGIEKYK